MICGSTDMSIKMCPVLDWRRNLFDIDTAKAVPLSEVETALSLCIGLVPYESFKIQKQIIVLRKCSYKQPDSAVNMYRLDNRSSGSI